MTDTVETGRWYWDRRTQKALYPRRVDGTTVEFLTVWHAEEVTDAVESGAVVAVDDLGPDDGDRPLDVVDSFRLPDDVGSPDHARPASERSGNSGGTQSSDSGGGQ